MSISSNLPTSTSGLVFLIAPRLRRSRAARFSAHKRYRKPFQYQYRTHVHAIRFQRAATPSVIAGLRSFRAFAARAAHGYELKLAIAHQVAEPSCRAIAQGTLGWALCVPGLRRIEANEAHVRTLIEDADGVAVDHPDLIGFDGVHCGDIEEYQQTNAEDFPSAGHRQN